MGLLTAWMEKHFVIATGVDWLFTPLDRILLAGRVIDPVLHRQHEHRRCSERFEPVIAAEDAVEAGRTGWPREVLEFDGRRGGHGYDEHLE